MAVFFKKSLAVFISLILFALLSTLSSGCSKTPEFFDLVISEGIKEETEEAVNIKNAFDFTVEEIYSSIKAFNIKGEDSFRFLWKDIESDTVIHEISDKYAEGDNRILEGWIPAVLTIKEGYDYLLEPGNYRVEFYHNNELKTSSDFSIKNPQAKILQVNLSNEVNEASEPLSPTQDFSGSETIYACAQIDFLVSRDNLKAKWLDQNNNLIIESQITIDENYYANSWVSFAFSGSGNEPMPKGIYSVVISLNDAVYGTYSFNVMADVSQTSQYFTQNNYYSEMDTEYGFEIAYPDNWQFGGQGDNSGFNVLFSPQNPNEAISLLLVVLTKDYPATSQELNSLMNDMAEETRGIMDYEGNPSVNNGTMADGTTYTEYIYYFTDKDSGQFGLIITALMQNDKMYIWYGFSHETYYEVFNEIYYAAFDSLSFNS